MGGGGGRNGRKGKRGEVIGVISPALQQTASVEAGEASGGQADVDVIVQHVVDAVANHRVDLAFAEKLDGVPEE